MRKEGSPSTINLDNITVAPTPVAAGVQKTYRGERTDDLSLPAGAYYIEVRNVDVAGSIQVNGESLGYNGIYHADVRTNQSAGTQDFVEAVEIVAAGRKYQVRVSYPSNHPINIDSL